MLVNLYMFSIPGLHRQIQKYARTRQTLMLVKFDSQKPCSAVSHPRLEGWFQCNHRRRAPSPVVCATRQMNLAREDIEDSESSTYIGVPSPRRALGVDYGRKFTGLAVSSGGFAPRELSPLRTPRSLQQLAGEIVVIAERERVDCVIVGLPVTRRGLLNKPETDSQQGRRCRNLAFTLAAVAASSPTGLEILLCGNLSA
uniref:YqgF/RNase H-like domain-containing protein n=1 Tax=Tetraselmis sp. GSL018 TaxID=582737 RepID=A0A061QRF8_9CHLO